MSRPESNRRRRLVAVLLGSVLAAAFLGPGTVTTAAKAGAEHGYTLLWALVFSTLATLVLQEAAGRLTVTTGLDLAQALRKRAAGGAAAVLVLVVVLGAVVVGCAAYEAGNILGGVAGAEIATAGLGQGWSRPVLTLLTGLVAAALLAAGSPRRVAMALAAFVALMGVAFLLTAVRLTPDAGALAAGALLPTLPSGAGLLALGLVGTTVVPYNLFLGSGVARGQTLGELRFGLAVAILLGGLISMGVLVVGAAVDGPFELAAVGEVLAARLGGWAGPLFAWGLFAAGLSSAVTAPLAAALTARGLFGERWAAGTWRYRAVWGGVLLTGLAFGLSGVRPTPAIVLAQALNGVLLPLVAVFLLLAVNDRGLVGRRGLNGAFSNTAMAAVTVVALTLGLTQIGRALSAVTGRPLPGGGWLLAVTGLVTVAIALPVARRAARGRAGSTSPAE